MSESDDKSKLHIDEDWKAQVEAEKAAARSAQDSGAAPGGQPAASESPAAAGQSAAADLQEPTPPPASLEFLITTIATQAMIALGQVPNPITGKVEARPKQAKHFIDTLAVVEQKTAGNRTENESALLTEVLHQLRMAYVMVSQQPGG